MNFIKRSMFCAILFFSVSEVYAEDSSEQTSQDYRQDKTWIATAQVVGLGPIPGSLTRGVSFGYFVNPDLIVSIEAVSGNSAFVFWDFTSYYRSVKYNSVGVHAKKFISRTFYFKAGLDANRFTEDFVYYNKVDNYGFDGDSISASLVIGNQWQFSHFTLGCDWVGAALPLTSNIKSEYASDAYQKSQLEDDKSRYLKSSGLQLVRFYLGASW